MENKKVVASVGRFNFAKGVGIILVVFAHTFAHLDPTQSFLLRVIYGITRLSKSGCMPMFFMISGYGFRKKKSKKMLTSSMADLLIPYCGVMLGYLFLYPLLYYKSAFGGWIEPTLRFMAKYIVAFLLGIGPAETRVLGFEVAWCTAAWYLLALFVALNTLNQILRIEKFSTQLICVLLCFFFGALLFKLKIVYYCLPQGLVAVGYCYAGYAFKKYNLFEKIQKSPWIYIVGIPVLFAQIKWGMFDLRQGFFKNILLDSIAAGISGVLFLAVLSIPENYDNRSLDCIKQIGMYSYWIMAMHSVEMEALPWWYWQRPLADRQLLAFVIEMVIKILIYGIGCKLLKDFAKRKYRKKMQKQKV